MKLCSILTLGTISNFFLSISGCFIFKDDGDGGDSGGRGSGGGNLYIAFRVYKALSLKMH